MFRFCLIFFLLVPVMLFSDVPMSKHQAFEEYTVSSMYEGSSDACLYYMQKSLDALKVLDWDSVYYYGRKVQDRYFMGFLEAMFLSIHGHKSDYAFGSHDMKYLIRNFFDIKNVALDYRPQEESFAKVSPSAMVIIKHCDDIISDNNYLYARKHSWNAVIVYSYIKKLSMLKDDDAFMERMAEFYRLNPEIFQHKRWDFLKRLYMRNVIFYRKQNLYEVAYHFLNTITTSEEYVKYVMSQWLLGWFSLEYLKDFEKSLQHFSIFRDMVKTDISKSRAYYWLGYVYECMGRAREAITWYRLGAQYKQYFYGQMSLYKLHLFDGNKSTVCTKDNIYAESQFTRLSDFLDGFSSIDEGHKDYKLYRNLYYFSMLRENALAFIMARKILRHANEGDIKSLFVIANITHNENLLLFLAKHMSTKSIMILDALYPLASKGISSGTYRFFDVKDTAWILSIIRQESAFDNKARSHAGALGIMQIMPSTAISESKRLGILYDGHENLYDPTYSTCLGSLIMRSLLVRYNESFVLSAAAYNAGEIHLRRWLNELGGFSELATIDEKINWIETIPFEETRSYIQSTIAGMNIYGMFLQGAMDIVSIENSLR